MGLFQDLTNAKNLRDEIKRLEDKKQQLDSATQGLQTLYDKIKLKQQELANLECEIESTKGRIVSEEIKAYTYPDKKTSSVVLQQQLDNINEQITILVTNNDITIHTTAYRLDGSLSKGEKFQQYYGESLIISFNNYFDKKAKAVTVQNYNKTCQLIEACFEKMNRRADFIGDKLNPKYLDLKLSSLKTLLDIKIIIAEERAREKEERRILREQEKLILEAEKAKAELARERRMYEQSLARALTEVERAEFEAKLKEIDKREADIDYRVNNSRAGYLYVTSTPAMPNLVKLGVTRRLQPLRRIQELSSASVPFAFVCHGLVFSDDAFSLETNIHEHFDSRRVNKENRHKEFFEISPQEAIDVLRNKFNCEVHFVDEDEVIESEEE